MREVIPILNRSSRAVFLCYHSVAPEGSKYLTVDRDLFEMHLSRLQKRGFRTGGLAELREVVEARPGPPTAFLTFDDGFVDNHSTVLPLLRERGMKAFCFVLPDLVDVGGPLAWPEVMDAQERYPRALRSVTWPMVEEMAEGGFEIGAHTITHPHLPHLDGEQLRSELSDSRSRVKDRLGRCDAIAYPFGEWNDTVARAARDCGYSFAFTLPRGGQQGATEWTIPRLNVDYRDSSRRFDLKLSTLGRQAILSPTVSRLRGRRQTNQGPGPARV